MFNNFFFPPENRAVYEITYFRAGQDTDDNKTQVAYWIPKATNTRSEYVILIAFPRQQWLFELASLLRLYVHCLFW
jgi:hypothetical protein